MDHVIYVIPYTSIIDQTAETFAEILGDENVLAHHSGADYLASENTSPKEYRKALAAENWDVPVIVTTSVQFFESLYANRSSRCRKLHSMANSVIIFDEAQTLPLSYLRPCVAAIAQLVQHYRACAVLCTATQPALEPLFAEIAPELAVRELCPAPEEQYPAFRRTRLEFMGETDAQSLGSLLCMHPQVLCIVNRRKTAQELYALLPAEGSYCLTTLLYPAHRQKLLREIRSRLEQGLCCRVVSTSLIEAGVDADFPAVFREEAGLDSVLQAAGRCNREGKRPVDESIVSVFRLEGFPPPAMLRTNVSAFQSIVQRFADPASLEAIRAYFLFFRSLKGSSALDAKGILPMLSNQTSLGLFPFASAADNFRLIETPSVSVYIPLEEGAALTAQLQQGHYSRALFRKLGQYAVPVYPDHLEKLLVAGAVQKLDENSYVLTDLRNYHEITGLSMEVENSEAWFV